LGGILRQTYTGLIYFLILIFSSVSFAEVIKSKKAFGLIDTFVISATAEIKDERDKIHQVEGFLKFENLSTFTRFFFPSLILFPPLLLNEWRGGGVIDYTRLFQYWAFTQYLFSGCNFLGSRSHLSFYSDFDDLKKLGLKKKIPLDFHSCPTAYQEAREMLKVGTLAQEKDPDTYSALLNEFRIPQRVFIRMDFQGSIKNMGVSFEGGERALLSKDKIPCALSLFLRGAFKKVFTLRQIPSAS
jgi:hypothetical protein